MKVLIVGANGMLGSTAFRYFANQSVHDTWGTVRRPELLMQFDPLLRERLLAGVDALNLSSVTAALEQIEPDIVLNCVGVVKQLHSANDPLTAIPLNALFPHQLAHECRKTGARLVHISTDCVFSGSTGGYRESDLTDARDLYGLSKLLGEVSDGGAITLRTSIVGPESGDSPTGLLGWFLSQEGEVRGFRNAFFSGFTTLELSKVIDRFVLPAPGLQGLYHASVERISKFDLLQLFKKVYRTDVSIAPDDELVIDRSLNSDRFQLETGFVPKPWPEMVEEMCQFQNQNK